VRRVNIPDTPTLPASQRYWHVNNIEPTCGIAHNVPPMKVNEELLYLHIAARLKARRVELGLTQQHLGDKVGLGRTSISNIEAGEQKPPLHVLYTICMALQVEPVDILPTIAKATTNPDQVTVMIEGKPMRVSRDASKMLLKIAELNQKGQS
jgi:transcriptional regulator with XRE-family HTH domain